MNIFAAIGMIAMLIALWVGQGQPYPANGFAVGMFTAGAVTLMFSEWLGTLLWLRRCEWEDRRDEARAVQEDADAEGVRDETMFGGQWE